MNRSPLLHAPLGYGLGARPQHYDDLLGEFAGSVAWLEALTENYLVPGGKPLHYLTRLRERYPIVFHGVSLSIGGSDPLDARYLSEVKKLINRFEPAWVSDHLCWTGVDGVNLHDLLPLPFTEAVLRHVVARVEHVQERLGRRIALENVSSYVSFPHSDMTEWEFVREVAERADCLLLLDVNNVYVSSRNSDFDPLAYLRGIPVERVQQFHLAGHRDQDGCLIDTHDAPVCDAVWRLFAAAVARFGPLSTMIERDDHIPPLADLLAELEHARVIAATAEAA
jgi:uncharacterized protein